MYMIYRLNAKGNCTSYGKKCDRIIYADKSDLPLTIMKSLKQNQNNKSSHKFCELVSFNRTKPYAIVIGANPAKGLPDKFDRTNSRIAKKIYRQKTQSGEYQYGGYVLVNLYTILTSSVEKLLMYINNVEDDSINDFSTILMDFLLQSSNDLYICWGPKMKMCDKHGKTLLQTSVLNLIINIINNNKNIVYYSANSKGTHIHPCDSSFTQFIQLTSNNLNQIK